MSEYFFGPGKGHLPKRAERIARTHGASLTNYIDPGCKCGHGCASACPQCSRHWFTAPNRGEPYNRAVAAAVMADLNAAGIRAKR